MCQTSRRFSVRSQLRLAISFSPLFIFFFCSERITLAHGFHDPRQAYIRSSWRTASLSCCCVPCSHSSSSLALPSCRAQKCQRVQLRFPQSVGISFARRARETKLLPCSATSDAAANDTRPHLCMQALGDLARAPCGGHFVVNNTAPSHRRLITRGSRVRERGTITDKTQPYR